MTIKNLGYIYSINLLSTEEFLYIGMTTNLNKRLKEHIDKIKIVNIDHPLNKYNFLNKNDVNFNILHIGVYEDKKDLSLIEQFFIKKYKPFYNIQIRTNPFNTDEHIKIENLLNSSINNNEKKLIFTYYSDYRNIEAIENTLNILCNDTEFFNTIQDEFINTQNEYILKKYIENIHYKYYKYNGLINIFNKISRPLIMSYYESIKNNDLINLTIEPLKNFISDYIKNSKDDKDHKYNNLQILTSSDDDNNDNE